MKDITVSKADLEKLYYSMKVSELCAYLGHITPARLYSLLRKAGIPTKHKFSPRKNINLVD